MSAGSLSQLLQPCQMNKSADNVIDFYLYLLPLIVLLILHQAQRLINHHQAVHQFGVVIGTNTVR